MPLVSKIRVQQETQKALKNKKTKTNAHQTDSFQANLELKKAVKEAIEELGDFKKFIKAGDRVLLKPNFNTQDPFPASSDLEFVRIVTELVYAHGAKSVIIGDSSTLTLKTRKVMEDLGIFTLEKMQPAPQILVFEEDQWVTKNIPKGKFLKKVSIPKILDKIDKLILLPCLKTHSMAQFSGSLKLSVGFMKPFERLKLHLKNLEEKIAELNLLIQPDLIIMDGRKCFIDQGPTHGTVREANLILASTDRIALDIEGIKVIQQFPGNSLQGLKPKELPQIKRMRELL